MTWDQTAGGVVPFIALGVAVASVTTKGGAAAFLGGVGIGLAAWDVYETYYQN